MSAKPQTKRKRRRTRQKVEQDWLKAAGWLMKTITALHNSPTGHGLKWTLKMILHYAKSYNDLRVQTPKACAMQAAIYDEEISSIIEFYDGKV